MSNKNRMTIEQPAGAAVRSSDGLDAVTLTLIADLLALYSTPLPCGDWDGAFDKKELVDQRLDALGWNHGKGPKPSKEVVDFFAAHRGI